MLNLENALTNWNVFKIN